jgi:hypothetical protein
MLTYIRVRFPGGRRGFSRQPVRRAAARRCFQSNRALVARCFRGNRRGTGSPDFGRRPRGLGSFAGVRREQHRPEDRSPAGPPAPLADVTSDERRQASLNRRPADEIVACRHTIRKRGDLAPAAGAPRCTATCACHPGQSYSYPTNAAAATAATPKAASAGSASKASAAATTTASAEATASPEATASAATSASALG